MEGRVVSPSGLGDAENSGRTLEGNEAQESNGSVAAATPGRDTGLVGGGRPRGRNDASHFGARDSWNGEEARAAVTRYGCWRGESSEGCETRFRGRETWLEAPEGVFSVVDPKRAEPHDRVQGATDLRGSRGGSRRSREERQGRNELEAGIFEPKSGSPLGSGRAIRIPMEGRLWKTPGEEFELPAQVGRLFGFVPTTGDA